METSKSSIQALVKIVKEKMFSNADPYSFVSPSAYDTAWLAMIPDTQQSCVPMFKDCLDWILNNQKEEGFWGGCGNGHGRPSFDCLPATLACLVALRRWNIGTILVEKGLAYIDANAEVLLREMHDYCPRWFNNVFPEMLELANRAGLDIIFRDTLKEVVKDMLCNWQRILEMEEVVDRYHYPPLLSYPEALPSSYNINKEEIIKHLSEDGSLFQSPSATAKAFMVTGNPRCLAYLRSLVQRCANGVPSEYPMDEELIKLCMVNQVHRLGLDEHFMQETEQVLAQIYRNYLKKEFSRPTSISVAPALLFKDSLAFRLLRMHGYKVSPWFFCWFLHDEEILDHLENNCGGYFSTTVMINVYRATDLMFTREFELEEARLFSRKVLEKAISVLGTGDQNHVASSNLNRMIKHELSLPWTARLDHLEHRMWIEENENNSLWVGKTSFHRFSQLLNGTLMQLAAQNYEYRQLIYKDELEELKRWSKDSGLSDMGFGREKTTYCYFAVAASSSLPSNSDVRMIVAKSAIIITVADDFYDMKGSLYELETLTHAVRRWDGRGLDGHSKTIFDALDSLVTDIAAKYLNQHGHDITDNVRYIWSETFDSWLTETKWSKSRCKPSMDEYIKTGMISIATHTIVLIASCFLNPTIPHHKLRPPQYETITKLVMVTARLLNDLQSYQKEEEEGKPNIVSLHLKENPDADIEEVIANVREILEKKKKELVEHVLMDGLCDFPKPSKHLHLSCLKVFEMFFNSSNRYDSDVDVLDDIGKAIYVPLEVGKSRPLQPLLPVPTGLKKEHQTITNCFHLSRNYRRSFGARKVSGPISKNGYGNLFVPPNINFCLV